MPHFKGGSNVVDKVVLSTELHIRVTNVYYTISTTVTSECARV